MFLQVCVISSVHSRVCVAGGSCMAGGFCDGGVHGRGGVCAGETATEAGGRHPTGMHTCYHPQMKFGAR